MDSIPPMDLNAALARLRAAQQRRTPDFEQRIGDLKRLRTVLQARLEDFAVAMSEDFGRRSRHESLLTDGMTVLSEIDSLRSHLRRWMRPGRAAANALFFPARAEIRYQPLGVVGVIAPWNYPVNLALVPLATAIAAGNHVMLKPSEQTPRTSRFAARRARRRISRRSRRDSSRRRRCRGAIRRTAVRSSVLHRIDRGRSQSDDGRGAKPDAGHAGTRRQIARHRCEEIIRSRRRSIASPPENSSTQGRPASRPTTYCCPAR